MTTTGTVIAHCTGEADIGQKVKGLLMQTRLDRERLQRAYVYETRSARTALGGCLLGLLIAGGIAAAGAAISPDDPRIAVRLAQERGRTTLTHAATEHSHAVYLDRQMRRAAHEIRGGARHAQSRCAEDEPVSGVIRLPACRTAGR
jgi:hypothetical protein